MLDIQHLSVWYGVTEVLRDVSFSVPSTVVALLGGNGSGKTTLLNTLIGLVRPAAGSVRFEGVECAGLAPDKIVRRGIVQVPQGREVWPGMTVLENLELGASTRTDRRRSKATWKRSSACFRSSSGTSSAGGQLSGGEQQMLAIGRALMARPRSC